MENVKGTQWHHVAAEKVLTQFDSDHQRGLDRSEAERRLGEFGPNRLPERPGPSVLWRLASQFNQPLVYLLVAAGLVMLGLREWVDAAVILGVVVINAVIGFWQESKAAKAIAALARMVPTTGRVIRSGERCEVPAENLVPGDIVCLQSGDKVPADLRLLSVRELQVDESALTGESLPVAKTTELFAVDTELADRRNMAFSSSLVTYGSATGVVVATGAQTEIGVISSLMASATDIRTPLTKRIAGFSHMLLWVILGLAVATFAIGVARGESAQEMFMAAVALAVGAIPEGLPAAVTIVLAIGVARMATRRAVVRRLPAVETLGSTTVICSDKTGTLTQNEMTVRDIWAGGERFEVTGGGYDRGGDVRRSGGVVDLADAPALQASLRAGVFCNDARLLTRDGRRFVQGDPTEGALLVVAEKAGLRVDEIRRDQPATDVIPFESQHQFMATLHADRNMFLKGAVETILQRCDWMLNSGGDRIPVDRLAVLAASESMAKRGLRVLAFAGGSLPSHGLTLTQDHVTQGLTLYGLQGMIDPPRPEAVMAVRRCQAAGVTVKMITGDHALTARAIAEQIGIVTATSSRLSEPVYTGAQLALIEDRELPAVAERTSVFARVTPEQKLRLVRALQSTGHVVAMTGDGVNDGPALKQADIGIAMGLGGTEVAKEAADVVLTDDHFATITAAIEEGRGVFDNLTKFLVWTLPTNLGEGLVIFFATICGTTLPILPLQILWINLTTSVLLGLTLAFEPMEPGVMTRRPRDPRQPIFTSDLMLRVLLVGALLLIASFGLFEWAIWNGETLSVARTVAVCVFVFGEMFFLLNCRSLREAPHQIGFFSNRWLWLGMGAMTLLQLALVYHPVMHRMFGTAPLGPVEWAAVVSASFGIFLVVEGEKWLRRRGGQLTIAARSEPSTCESTARIANPVGAP